MNVFVDTLCLTLSVNGVSVRLECVCTSDLFVNLLIPNFLYCNIANKIEFSITL